MCNVRYLLAFFCAATAVTASSEASARRAYRDGGFVTAYSNQGTSQISAPVRRGQWDWQVQLPSGRWIDCGGSCEETLRIQTIDFFENSGSLSGYGTRQRKCGIFGCLQIGNPS